MSRTSYPAVVAMGLALVLAGPSSAATFTVDTTSDLNLTTCGGAVGDCSLRGAINRANGNAGPDEIHFNLGVGTPTILVGESGGGTLPAITEQLMISGSTNGATRIALTGFPGLNDGLRIASGASAVTIRSLVINDFDGDGIEFASGTGNGHIIRNCYIGTDATGTSDRGNANSGIRIAGGTNHIIGGLSAGQPNVISGNGLHGIEIASSTAGNWVAFVTGNRIGLNAAGTAAIPNSGDGIRVGGGRACIGGSISSGQCIAAVGSGNVVSGNGSDGIEILSVTNGHKIWGNRIGLNAAGTADLGNVGAGIRCESDSNEIGGTAPLLRNIISGNHDGIALYNGARENQVIGNYIGTDATGLVDIGNDAAGINLSHYFTPSGPVANRIGGESTLFRNLISGNGIVNIFIADATTTGNVIVGNAIGPDANGGAGLTNGVGILVTAGADNNTIGFYNVISDNTIGIQITGAGTNGTIIQRNLIGTDATGLGPLPNTQHGISITDAGGATIGGSGMPLKANTIAYNLGDGIRISGATAITNEIIQNSVHSNGGLGINNVSGGNNELTPPVITAVGSASGTTCGFCVVEVYSDSTDEGRIYQVTGVADGSGNWSVSGHFLGPYVTAIARDAGGNTSEFSAPFQVTTDVDIEPPSDLRLLPVAPNPFRVSALVRLDLPRREAVRLTIHDLNGRLVRTLLDGTLPPGRHERLWDGIDSAGRRSGSGVYFVRLSVGDEVLGSRFVRLN